MAAISEIRVVNLHYAHQRSYYEDLSFQFLTENGIPCNGAITFPNGNGKGALEQAINQIFLPETHWGSKNENTPLHYFMKNNKFEPYTFYVIIEWWVSFTRRLMTGIAMTAEEIADPKPEYKIRYRLFGKKYQKNEFDIKTLPVWDEATKTAKKFADFEVFLMDEKGIFHSPPSGKGNFFKECRTYGIYESDWAELKKINRYEAGIGPYFEQKNATKNETFFRNMLIPSIVERNEIINNIDIQTQLSQQFKDCASIANNLPYLLAREKYHREILDMVARFDSPFANYEDAQNQIKEHKKAGENIIANIDALIKELEGKAEGAREQIADLTIKDDENKWKKDNLKYVSTSKELQEKKEELELAEQIKQEAAEAKQNTEQQCREAEKRLLVKKFRVEEKQFLNIQNEINRLEQSSELKEITTKSREIKQRVKEKWGQAEKEVSAVVHSYHGYMNHLNNESEKIQNRDHQLSVEIGGIKMKLSILGEKIEAFESQLEIVKQKFGYSVHVKPEEAKEKIRKEINSSKKILLEAEQAETILNNKYDTLSQSIAVLGNKLTNINDQWVELNQKHALQQKKQMEWMNKTADLLKLSLDECNYSFEWLQSMVPKLSELLEKLTKREKEFNVELLKLEQQLQISDYDHFLLNADIQRISEKLSRYHVYHQIGSEFLMELEETQRKKYNQLFPHLKYSIIVQTQNLQDLKQKLNFTDELLQSPVNLIEAKSLENLVYNGFLFSNKADEFVETPEKWNEYFQLSLDNKVKLEEEILIIGSEIGSILQLVNILTNFTGENSAEFFFQEANCLETELDATKQDRNEKMQQLEEVNRKINENKEIQKETTATLYQKEQSLIDLDQFQQNYQQNKKDLALRDELIIELTEKEGKQKKLRERAGELENEVKNWQFVYAEWKAEKHQVIKRMTNIVPNATFPKEEPFVELTGEIQKPFLTDTIFDHIIDDVSQYEQLTSTLEQKSAKISELTGMNKVNIQKMQDAKEELLSFVEGGLQLPEPAEPIEILKRQKEKTVEKANQTAQALHGAEKSEEVLTAEVRNIQKQADGIVDEIRQIHSRQVEEWDDADLDVLAKEIAEETERVQKKLNEKENEAKEMDKAKITVEKARLIIAVKLGISGPVVFEIIENIIEEVKENPARLVQKWNNEFEKRKRRRDEAFSSLNREKRKSIEDIKGSTWDEKTKQSILEQYNSMDINNISSIKETVQGIRMLSTYELEVMEEDKQKGIEARDRWVKHAAQFSSNIVKAIIEMEESMEIKNRGGFIFPLVKIKNKRKLSTKVDEYSLPLERYFSKAIQKANRTGIQIDALTIREINQIINIADIVYNALGNQYPQFDIYNLNDENVFMYDAPRSEYFVDWEVLNEASLTTAAGSGGQKVSGKTIMFLMMMSHKRRVSDKDWQFIYMDNPLANAVSASVVDPIIAVTEALHYQLIVLAPPELMKAEIAMKFPSFHDLSFEKQPSGKRKVSVNRRQYVNPAAFMTEEFEDEIIGFSSVKNADFEQGEFLLD